LRHVAIAKTVTPLVESLRAVADAELGRFAGGHFERGGGGVLLVCQQHIVAVDREYKIVVNRLSGGELEFELNCLFFVARVAEAVDTVEFDFVSAVPEQAFLAVLEIEIDVDLAALER